MEPLVYPIRINRYIAHKGYATRRGADLLVAQGHITINGKIAKLGDKVNKNDDVFVPAKVIAKSENAYRYVAYYKPRGISTDIQIKGDTIKMDLPALRGLFPIGRLDKDSKGLLILTNDGRLTERILSPHYAHEKEYIVKVDKKVSDSFIRHLERGILIEGYKTKKSRTWRTGETIFHIVLTEGKKHQIRRMCTAKGYQVTELMRVRIMNISLGNLKEGTYRAILGTELETLKKGLGL